MICSDKFFDSDTLCVLSLQRNNSSLVKETYTRPRAAGIETTLNKSMFHIIHIYCNTPVTWDLPETSDMI